jgi:hypothetical protein
MAPVPLRASEGAPNLPTDLKLAIEYLPIASLASGGRKLRLHKKADIVALARAIETFGFLVPVLIDQDGRVVSAMAGWRPHVCWA